MPGEELALAIAGVVLAGPPIVIPCQDLGTYILKRVDTISRGPELVLEFKQKWKSVCTGQLQARADLIRCLKQMQQILDDIKILLDKLHIEKDGYVNKGRLMLPLSGHGVMMRRAISKDSRSCRAIFNSLSIWLKGQQEAAEPPKALSSSRFKPLCRQNAFAFEHIEPNSHIYQGYAQVLDGTGRTTNAQVIIERSKEVASEEIPTIAGYLLKIQKRQAINHQTEKVEHRNFDIFKKIDQPPGLLICLGFTDKETPQHLPHLVFQLPEKYTQCSKLRSTILKTPTAEYGPGGGQALENRYRLAHLLSESVLSVHTADFVHKNIRPDTILLLRPSTITKTDPSATLISVIPHLTYWSLLRKANEISPACEPQERYNIGHDIYSLGICLLEIELWEPLIVTKSDPDVLLMDINDTYDISEQTMCGRYRKMAVRLQLVTQSLSASVEVLTRCGVVAKVMVALTEEALPQTMSTAYANIVIACLKCLDGGFGVDVTVEDFMLNITAVALVFKMLVVEPLSRMY